MKRVLEHYVLGLVPRISIEHADRAGLIGLINLTLPRSLVAEAFKAARTNLEVLRRNRSVQVLLITSPMAGGKANRPSRATWPSASRRWCKVLLIDADIRCPTQHKVHNLPRDRGLVQLLSQSQPLGPFVQPRVTSRDST